MEDGIVLGVAVVLQLLAHEEELLRLHGDALVPQNVFLYPSHCGEVPNLDSEPAP